MSRTEIPLPADRVQDTAGNVLAGRAVTLKIADTATVATHYSAVTGGTSTTGGLVVGTDGTVVDGSAARRYVDEGPYDLTVAGITHRVEAVSGLVAGKLVFINVKGAPYSAKGDGSTDDTTAIQAAINAANTATGGTVYFPTGTYIASALTLYSNIEYVGDSAGATVLKLKASTNADFIKTSGFDSLTGGGTAGGVNGFAVRRMTIDGNKANNATGGTGLKIYGWDYQIEDVAFRNCKVDGAYSEWSAAGLPTDATGLEGLQMESRWERVIAFYNDRNGIYFNGPHDSTWHSIYPHRNGAKGIHIGTQANGMLISDSHSWGFTQTYAWYIEAPVSLFNCVGEGATVSQVMIGAADVTIEGGQYFCNDYGAAALVGIEIGDATHTLITRARVHATFLRCVTAAIKFTSDGGNCDVDANIYYESGHSGTAWTGTIASSTRVRAISIESRTTFPAADKGGVTHGTTISERRVVPSTELVKLQNWHQADGTRVAAVDASAGKQLQVLNNSSLTFYSDDGTTERQKITSAGTRLSLTSTPLRAHFSGSKTFDFPSVAAAAQTTTTVTVTGAVVGDVCTVGLTVDLQGMQLTGYVSAADTVTVVLRNGTAGAIDLASATLRASVQQY